MAMTVRNAAELARAGRKNAPLRRALDQWLDVTEHATWHSLRDVRRTSPTADGVIVKVRGGLRVVATVFNIKGNEYRLITVINYAAAVVVVREVLTHAEYSKDDWKDRL
jgi:mRNA interferase HigB